MKAKKLRALAVFYDQLIQDVPEPRPFVGDGVGLTAYERVRLALGASGPADIAETLGTTRSNAASWQKRGHVPVYWLCKVRRAEGHSVHWLAFGEAPLESEKRSQSCESEIAKSNAPVSSQRAKPLHP